ncbi:hypothetical protein L4C34_11605 [Vibrio profundum]|uniref:hypothetical protein n=1 Tax=Vibrio profundum TaxID=2910247 RepID=UPI003D10BBA9
MTELFVKILALLTVLLAILHMRYLLPKIRERLHRGLKPKVKRDWMYLVLVPFFMVSVGLINLTPDLIRLEKCLFLIVIGLWFVFVLDDFFYVAEIYKNRDFKPSYLYFIHWTSFSYLFLHFGFKLDYLAIPIVAVPATLLGMFSHLVYANKG